MIVLARMLTLSMLAVIGLSLSVAAAEQVVIQSTTAQMLGPVINPELVAQHACRDVVCDVMINGHWVLREKEFVHLDEKEIREGFSEQRQECLNRSSRGDRIGRTDSTGCQKESSGLNNASGSLPIWQRLVRNSLLPADRASAMLSVVDKQNSPEKANV